AFQCRAWACGGPAGPLCRAGRDLVVHSVHRPEPLALGAPQSDQAAHRSPDPDAVFDWRYGSVPRVDRAQPAESYWAAPPVRAHYGYLGTANPGLVLCADGGWYHFEGVERVAHRVEA